MSLRHRQVIIPPHTAEMPCWDTDVPDYKYHRHMWVSQIADYSDEYMTPNGRGPIRQWKPIQHYKRWMESKEPMKEVIMNYTEYTDFSTVVLCGSDPFAGYWTDEADVFGGAGKFDKGLPVLFNGESETGLVPLPENIDELKALSVRTMSPNIRSELSLLNSIYELKDFRSIPRLLARIRDCLTVRIPQLLRGLNSYRNAHELALAMDDVYLQKQFNINPLISDIAGLYLALSRTRRRIESLVSASGRLTTKHFMWRSQVEPVVETLDWQSKGRSSFTQSYDLKRSWDQYWSTEASAITRTTRTVTTQPVEFRAHMQFTYQYSADQVAHKQLYGLLDAFGVNFNPAIVWNAIPWTFVLDWVINVSRWLDGMKVANMNPTIDIQQYCWSVKQARKIEMASVITNYYKPSYDQDLLLYDVRSIKRPTVYETAYRREVGLPAASLLTTSGLNSREFTLGAALAFTKTKRRKRKMGVKTIPIKFKP